MPVLTLKELFDETEKASWYKTPNWRRRGKLMADISARTDEPSGDTPECPDGA